MDNIVTGNLVAFVSAFKRHCWTLPYKYVYTVKVDNMQYAVGMGAPTWLHVFGPELLILLIWGIFWKGLALWHSAQRGHVWWFVIMLIINTAGILEIIYLFGIAKIKFDQLFSNKHHH